MKYFGLITGLALAVGACTEAEWRSINRDFNPTHGNSKLIDAKQRALISVKRPLIGADGKYVRDGKDGIVTSVTFCAEPSPDALQATASALAGAGSASKEAVEAAFNLSISGSESVASIGLRTQTIQLLRDSYYRLCEAYLNDGLDSIGYDVLQRRVQNQIIALLAVEQLTGAVVASQAALSTSSSADAGAQAGLIANLISTNEAQKNEVVTQKAANEKALKDLTEAAKALTGDALETNKLEQAAVQRRIDANDAEIKRLDTLLGQLNTALQEAAQKTITANSQGIASLTGGSNNSGGAVSEHVANTVRAITLNAINQDYERQVCFESLRYRNHTQQYKNDLNTVFGPLPDQTRIAGVNKDGSRKIDSRYRNEGGKFLQYCEGVFFAERRRREAMADLVAERKHQINHIVHAVARDGKIDATDGAIMIQALEQASPMEPGAAFLPRSFEVSRDGFKVEVKKLIEAELATAAKKKK